MHKHGALGYRHRSTTGLTGKLSGAIRDIAQVPGRKNGLFLYKDFTRIDLVWGMDIRIQNREKKIETEIARLKSDYAGYTGYAGHVVGDQFRFIGSMAVPPFSAGSQFTAA